MKVQTHAEVLGGGRDASRFARSMTDLARGFANWQLWSTLAWHSVRNRYRRSLLGPFWITLSMGLFIVGIGVLYSSLFGYPMAEYLPYLALGFILWSLISGTVTSGCATFTAAASAIRQVRAPISLHMFQMFGRELLVFAHIIVIVPIVLAAFNAWPGWVGLLAVPGFAMMFLTCAGAALALAVVSTRFRDVPPIIATFMRVAFFFTPILWKAESSKKAIFVDVNPFYYLIEVVRAPVLGKAPEPLAWVVVAGLMLATWGVALMLYGRFRHRIAFWA